MARILEFLWKNIGIAAGIIVGGVGLGACLIHFYNVSSWFRGGLDDILGYANNQFRVEYKEVGSQFTLHPQNLGVGSAVAVGKDCAISSTSGAVRPPELKLSVSNRGTMSVDTTENGKPVQYSYEVKLADQTQDQGKTFCEFRIRKLN